MKQYICVIVSFWLGLNILAMVNGIYEHRFKYSNSCKNPIIRAEYIFPGSLLGCWLGEEVK